MDELIETGVCCEGGDKTGFWLCPSHLEGLGRVQGSALKNSKGGVGLWNDLWNVETTGREAGANLRCTDRQAGANMRYTGRQA